MTCDSNAKRGALRKKILAARDALSAVEREEKSTKIQKRLWSIPAFAEARVLCVYVNFRSEVETMGLIKKTLARKIIVVAPRTLTASSRLVTYAIQDPARDLQPGAFGILEPAPDEARLVEPMDIDVVLLPGSVFDTAGGRLGYGGGYYDRFLANEARRAIRIGICFEAQVVDRVPVLAHDQLLEYLVTEDRVVSIEKNAERKGNL